MRREFGKVITDLAAQDERLYLITGDIGHAIFDDFRAKFSSRFINMGICEQSMIGVAAGMAFEGLHPWVYTITPFLIERPYEQVKLDIAQQRANVKLVGYADYPDLGPTHAVSDERLLDRLGISCYYPKDSAETRACAMEAYQRIGPAFISLKEDKALRKK